jgi:hypothetical protein
MAWFTSTMPSLLPNPPHHAGMMPGIKRGMCDHEITERAFPLFVTNPTVAPA